MTASELIAYQLDDAGYQLEQVFSGIDGEQQDHQLHGSAYTPRQVLEHLCECYTAFIASTEGREHSWGTFSIEDKGWENLLGEFRRLRAQAAALAKAADDEKTLKNASAYIVLHDTYHVGQLAASRLIHDPNWDPFSIYQH